MNNIEKQKLTEEFEKHIASLKLEEVNTPYELKKVVIDFWLSKIDELLKSQREEINDNWKSKLKEIHNKCKTERGLSVALLNLIKEE